MNAVHFESHPILYNVITNNSELEWRRKMAGAHPRPQFSEDERVLIVLKCTETNIVVETTRCFQRQFRCIQTLMDKYKDKHVKMVYL